MPEQTDSKPVLEEKDNPEARRILQAAFNKTWRWADGFPGFSSEIEISDGGRINRGRLEVEAGGGVKLDLDAPAVKDWLQGQLEMLVVHRRPRSFEESDGKHVLALGPDDGHPYGRVIRIFGDGMNSYYRIRNDRITQINRKNNRVQFTINVDESMQTSDGRHLTTRHTVFYFNPATRSLRTVESYADEPCAIGGVYLPSSRTVNLVNADQVLTRRIVFKNHRILSR